MAGVVQDGFFVGSFALMRSLLSLVWGSGQRLPAASWASETSADSKLLLWHAGAFMSPSSLCDATEHPPAQTGMKLQSPQLRHALSESKRDWA